MGHDSEHPIDYMAHAHAPVVHDSPTLTYVTHTDVETPHYHEMAAPAIHYSEVPQPYYAADEHYHYVDGYGTKAYEVVHQPAPVVSHTTQTTEYVPEHAVYHPAAYAHEPVVHQTSEYVTASPVHE